MLATTLLAAAALAHTASAVPSTRGNVALLRKCATCMGGDNVQIGSMFAQQCPVAVKALASNSVGSQPSSTGGSAVDLPSATSIKSSASSALSSAVSGAASAAHTSTVASRSAANGTVSQPAQTSQPAPGSAAKAVVSLLSVGVVGFAVLLA